MSFGIGSLATSADINDLKTIVKQEMARRNQGTGSLSSYATDFSQSANQRDPIRISHFNETVGYIDKISPTNITGVQNGLIYTLDAALTKLNAYTQTAVTSTTSDCVSACTGLCATSCATNCRNGCKGSCSSCTGCSGCSSCSGSCSGGCSGCSGCSGCGDSCHSNCTPCTGSCYFYCTVTCASWSRP